MHAAAAAAAAGQGEREGRRDRHGCVGRCCCLPCVGFAHAAYRGAAPRVRTPLPLPRSRPLPLPLPLQSFPVHAGCIDGGASAASGAAHAPQDSSTSLVPRARHLQIPRHRVQRQGAASRRRRGRQRQLLRVRPADRRHERDGDVDDHRVRVLPPSSCAASSRLPPSLGARAHPSLAAWRFARPWRVAAACRTCLRGLRARAA